MNRPARRLNRKSNHSLAAFNQALERDSSASGIHESWLVEKTKELETIGQKEPEVYWLSLARINELALFCAGNYADCGELQATGDLLVNPRLIMVRVKNQAMPVKKERPTPLTQQFAPWVGSKVEVRQWLKFNTIIEIREKPLLMHLWEDLRDGGWMTPDYLVSVENRLQKIADVLILVSTCHLPSGLDFHQHLRQTSPDDRAFLMSRLCRFDHSVFDELGREIDIFGLLPNYRSRFLKTDR
ncbi:MAG: hypothetical protein V1742_01520 [Pseudomonadota bacterium]